MTDNTLTYETAKNIGLEEDNVIVTANSGAFPSGFTNATQSCMVVIDTTLAPSRKDAVQSLQRILKAIMEDQSNFVEL